MSLCYLDFIAPSTRSKFQDCVVLEHPKILFLSWIDQAWFHQLLHSVEWHSHMAPLQWLLHMVTLTLLLCLHKQKTHFMFIKPYISWDDHHYCEWIETSITFGLFIITHYNTLSCLWVQLLIALLFGNMHKNLSIENTKML